MNGNKDGDSDEIPEHAHNKNEVVFIQAEENGFGFKQ